MNNLAAISPHRAGLTSADMASRLSPTTVAAAAAAAEAGVPHGEREEGTEDEDEERCGAQTPSAGHAGVAFTSVFRKVATNRLEPQ